MGRLFWKFCLVFWLVLTAVGGAAAWFAWQWREAEVTAMRAARSAELAAAEPGSPTERSPTQRPRGAGPPWAPGSGHGPGPFGPRGALGPPHRLASLVSSILVGLLASLVASGLLAWHLAKPVRSLSWAFDAVASGRLDTRVAPRMGRRRDEIADLGRGFDRMTAQLEQLVAAQRRLLHEVSHELRSPLARLEAAVGLARQSPEKLTASLDRIEREAARLDALVGQLLTLSHLEAGTAGEPRERLDLVELVAGIIEDARFEARLVGRDVSFTAVGEALGEVHVDVHAEALHRALENVIRNAVRHTALGTTVEVEIAAAVGRQVHIEIRDRGPGVATPDLERIFEPFYRGEAAPATASGGVGLGLAIARQAIALHRGQIAARNRTDGGLVVAIDLPLSSSLA
jgi:two-component system OmpR family sensor kinase